MDRNQKFYNRFILRKSAKEKIRTLRAPLETTFSHGEVGNRIYRSRGTLRVVHITKICQREKKGGTRSPLLHSLGGFTVTHSGG